MRGHILRMAASLLLLALPLAGCGGRSGSVPSENLSERESPAEISSSCAPLEQSPSAPLTEQLPSSAVQKEEAPAEPFLPAEAALEKSAGEQAVWELRFSSVQPVNFILLPEGLSAKAAVVQSGEKEIYRSLPESDSRLLRFDTERTASLTLLLEAPQGEGMPKAGLLSGKTDLSAYLPASTRPDMLESYAASLERLKQITVITGLCWDKNGQILLIDENYPALIEKLCALREEYGFSICSTLYPARPLIQEGKAGALTEKNQDVLISSILSHAQLYRLDGIDFDWETPKDAAEWEICSALIAGLGEKKEEAGLFLSAALYPENTGKLSGAAMAALDRLHLMNYDQFDSLGRHAAFERMAGDIRQALQDGWLPGQLAAGLPAYGRPLDGSARWPLYCDQPLPLTGNLFEGSYFNSPQMVRDKAAYCQLLGIDGAFFFHLTGDLPADAPFSLIGAVD